MACEIRVERVGNIVVTSLKGMPTSTVIIEANRRILELINETGLRSILYDGLEMQTPTFHSGLNIAVTQWKCNEAFAHVSLRRAIVVHSARLAFLARLAFGDSSEYQVFYNDKETAIQWLTQS